MAGELVATILYRSGGAALRVRRGGGGWATTDPRPRTRPAAHSLRQLDTPLNISNMFVPWSRAPALRIHCTTETPSPPAAGPVWYCTRQPPPNLRLTHEAWHPPTRHQVQRLDFSASLIMCVGDIPCFAAGEGSREAVGAPAICTFTSCSPSRWRPLGQRKQPLPDTRCHLLGDGRSYAISDAVGDARRHAVRNRGSQLRQLRVDVGHHTRRNLLAQLTGRRQHLEHR